MADFNPLTTAARILKRESAYYWVKFPYPSGEIHWEVASYDEKCGAWAMIGSMDLWFEFQLLRIGPRIEEPNE